MEDKESTSSFSVPEKAVKQSEQFTKTAGAVRCAIPLQTIPDTAANDVQGMGSIKGDYITKTQLLLDNSPNTTSCNFLIIIY